jgi:sugar phosphate isomerase/epimerase
MGPIAEEELVKILDGEGMVCCATHESGEVILNTPEKVVERLQKLRCKITAYPFPGGIDFSSEESVMGLIGGLNRSGEVLADAGLTLCYHNHANEFRKLNGSPIFDLIYERTNPRFLQGEPDTYWVQYGGGCNIEVCEKLEGRLPIIHLKDYRITEKNHHMVAEIGAGNLNFKKIIAAADAAGCEWFAVEQDSCPGNPLDSLEQSFNYIRDHLV